MYALPKPVLQHFESGAFVSNIKGYSYSSVGIDEAHEMLINKHCKSALSHSLPTDMDKVCQTLEYQSKLIESFQNQLADVKHTFQRDLSPSVIFNEMSNTKVYFEKMQQSNVFNTNQSPALFQAFSNTSASKLQQHNLLHFRDIGQDSLNLNSSKQVRKLKFDWRFLSCYQLIFLAFGIIGKPCYSSLQWCAICYDYVMWGCAAHLNMGVGVKWNVPKCTVKLEFPNFFWGVYIYNPTS